MKADKAEREEAPTSLEAHVLAALEGDPAVRAALVRLAAAGMEPSAYSKKLRALRPVAAEAFRLGGGARLVEADVTRLTYTKAEVSSRLSRTVDPVLRVGLQAQVESLTRDLQDKAAILQASGLPQPDHAAELRDINAQVDEAEAIIRKYKAAELPTPRDLMERIVAAREKLLAIEALEKTRRAAFDEASAQASKLRQEALGALSTSVVTMARAKFHRVVDLLQKSIRVCEVFPDEADPAIAQAWDEFQTDADLAERLGRSKAFVEDTCWRELPEREREALRRVLKLGMGSVARLQRRSVGDLQSSLGDESGLGAA